MHSEDRQNALTSLRLIAERVERLAGRAAREERDRVEWNAIAQSLRQAAAPLAQLDRYVTELEEERRNFESRVSAIADAAFAQVKELSEENTRLRLAANREPVPSGRYPVVLTFPKGDPK